MVLNYLTIFALLVALATQVGCAPAKLQSSDERLTDFIEEFKTEARSRGVNPPELNYLSAKVVSDVEIPGLMGVCTKESGSSPVFLPVTRWTVRIAERALKEGDFTVKVTMFHELGHCFLGLDHDDSSTLIAINRNGVNYSGPMPLTIMHKTFFNYLQLPVAKLYWKQYLDELFGLTANPFTEP
jgi:hypothetical protein